MLEKLGLPSKPSNRGAAWVVDASHCQGCSGQFTFINRKHHCRRCGGLFCGSCTQQRMILRGQGDSPVRICEPCKKLEEAARFELRYGHKNKAAKGNMKHTSINEEEVLNQILGTNKSHALASAHESHFDVSSNNLQKSASSASSSSLNEESAAPGRDIGIPKSLSVGTTRGSNLIDIDSTTPEELRQQAVEQKNKYRILKGEGKSEEALQAFKHGRELERQAASLELALRKNRRMASKASNVSNLSDTQKTDNHEESRIKKPPSQRVKEGKDDLSADLRELGWSDADLHDADNKPVKPTTLEGELLNLLGEIPKKPSSGSGAGGIDRTQVTAHKKKALSLKREGKLTEAKEELKKAKILEKKIEEQELLGEDEDSDDELSVLIRSMKDDKPDELLLGHAPDPGLDFEHLLGSANDFALDDNFEVTDEDLNNPELAADLKSFGWSDEEDEYMGDADSLLQPAHFDLEALREKALALKREALSQKRAGNVAEAMALLKEAKLLEKELENRQSDVPTFAEPSVVSVADERNIVETVKMPPKSKIMIQRELLNVKKKALALRREGHVEEAEEELKKGKILEEQLEEMENGPKRPALNVGKKVVQPAHTNIHDDGISDLTDEVEAVVTDQDMNDPALLSVLENLGWNDDNNTESVSVNTDSFHQSVPSVTTRKATRSKAVVQKELLGVKRNALALRRQGRTQEADEELERAKVLENELSDIENANSAALESHDSGSFISQETPDSQKADSSAIKSRIIKDAETWSSLKSSAANIPHSTSESLVRTASQYTEVPSSVNVVTEPRVEANRSSDNEISSHRMSGSEVMHKSVATTTNSSQSETVELSNIHDFDAQKSEISVRKRKAVALKREGKLVEAREELRQAKLLEKSLEDAQQAVAGTENASTSLENSPVKQEGTTVPARKPVADVSRVPKPVSGRDRFKLQQESLSHKRTALKLRREGKIAESEAEFELAKALESQLEELGGGSSTGKAEVTDDASVEDIFDPQLMSALKSIGWGGSDFATLPSGKSEPKTSPDKGANTRSEKDQLEEQIKGERLRALNFKRAGKQGEALEALRAAKRLEKKLGLLTS